MSALLVGILLVVALLAIGVLVRGGPTQVDVDVAASVMGWFPAALTDLFDTLASLPVVAALVVVGLLVSLLRQPGAAVGFLVGLASELPSTLVKTMFDRPRPPGGDLVEAFGSAASYPSGHTVRAVVIAGLFVALVWTRSGRTARWAAAIVVLAVVGLVGLARIASGQHWPTDVVGGILLGGAWLIVCLGVEAAFTGRNVAPSGP